MNKPNIRAWINKFYDEVEASTVIISEEFKSQVDKILNKIPKYGSESKQLGVSHIDVKVGDNVVSSVSSDYSVDESNIRAIIEGSLPKIVEKVMPF